MAESTIDPVLRPYLEQGLQRAEQLFMQQTPSLYPGQMYVSPSQQTLQALQAQEAMATAPQPTLEAGQTSFLAGLQGLQRTATSPYEASPYLPSAIQAATRPIQQQFEQTTLPGVASLYSRAGRFGSGAMERAVGTATEATGRAIGDIASNLAYQDYANALQRQQQAQGALIQGATLAPQIYAQQFLPTQQLAQVGAAREAIAAQPLQEAIQRYQFEQQAPIQQLQSFLSSVYGTPLASSNVVQPRMQINRFGQVLGGAATGAGLANLAGMNPLYGAGLGGLTGLLF
jgi:hypothetical protein